MDQDRRKSTVSSFYGAGGGSGHGRRPSQDALNADFPPSPSHAAGFTQPQRPSMDPTRNSFYDSPLAAGGHFDPNPPGVENRHSVAPYGHAATNSQSAGYNRGSFFHTGREEPLRGGDEDSSLHSPGKAEPWDVYADFNNAGPRYSSGTFGGFGKDAGAYQQLPPGAGTPGSKGDYDAESERGGVEMVTVPALGAEWGKDEMKAMTQRGKNQAKAEKRREKVKRFWRGDEGICGVQWLRRKVIVIGCFALIIVMAVVLAFTIPRVPTFAFNASTPLLPATGSFNDSIPTLFSPAPANFSFAAQASIQVNTQSNFLPLTFNHLRAEVYDLDTNRQVGEGEWEGTVPGKAFTDLLVPLNFTYGAQNNSDQTWKNWHGSCRNRGSYADNRRPVIKFRLLLHMGIAGLIGDRTTATEVSNADCPFELPLNAS